ncbi:MAG: ribonuclease H-like domain-containing protein [Clostridiales bacterium]|nr:ribonuclease H-like domain-containing protein [Clostridiales bacterium]
MILDIETTGLSPLYTEVILIGIIYFEDSNWKITQIFCDHRKEEKELLLKLQTYIKETHMLITYNGHAFDIPYLNKRYKHHELDYQINPNMNFDLYRVIRSSKKALKLPNYKLKTIEEYLGIYRQDEISGKESVELYNQYEKLPSKELRDIILLHNYDDILYMIPTLEIINHIPESITDRYYPFVIETINYGTVVITGYKEEHSYINILAQSNQELKPMIDYSDGFGLEIMNRIIKLKVPTFYIGNRIFIDVDSLPFYNSSFNDLILDEQLKLEVTSKKNALTASLKLLETHSL